MKTLVWAVDPLAQEKTFQRHFVRVVASLSKGFPGLSIHPVYVVNPPNPYIPEKARQEFFEATRQAVIKAWPKLVGRTSIEGLQAAEVLACDEFSTKAAASTLLEYAKKKGADALAVGTHARRGVSRAILGSFSETIILQGDIPTIVINPRAETRSKIRHIFYPTDLSEGSRKVFLQVLDIAKITKARVTAYHKVEFIPEVTAPSLFQFPNYEQYADEDLKRREEGLELLLAAGKMAGVKVATVLDKGKKAPGDAILARVKKDQPDFIAMASQTGPVASALLGSVTRQVVRAAPVPVWVLHPEVLTLSEQMLSWVAETTYLSGIR